MNTSGAITNQELMNIPSKMKNLEEKLCVLSEEEDRLANRLGDILLPLVPSSSAPSSKQSDEKKADSCSELAIQLEGFAERIQNIIYRLRNLIERLDL